MTMKKMMKMILKKRPLLKKDLEEEEAVTSLKVFHQEKLSRSLFVASLTK